VHPQPQAHLSQNACLATLSSLLTGQSNSISFLTVLL
jgi:hypothetical protein